MIAALSSSVVSLFADVVFIPPSIAHCKTLEEGSWTWWLYSCWMWDSPAAATVVVSVTLAAFVGVQLWARSKGGK